jgi:EpsI family protein
VASVIAVGLAVRATDIPLRPAPLDEITIDLGGWHGEDAPVPETIPETLGYDRVLHRTYRNKIGQDIHVWVIFWSRIRWDRGYHHPDLCLGNQGWRLLDRRSLALEFAPDAKVPATIRRFRSGDRSQLVCYWTQEGARVWNDADEAEASRGGSHRWISEGLKGRVQSREARISVLIDTELWGTNQYPEDALLSFCRLFAAELYRVLPWAVPK